jgi:hypothetical protein
MLLWPAAQSQLSIFLSKNKGRTIDQLAKKIGSLYHQAVMGAFPKQVPGFSPVLANFLGLNPKPIEAGFKTTFKTISKLKTKPTPAHFMPAASGVLLYWTGKMLNPAAPPPIPGWIGVSPGVPPVPPLPPIGVPPSITHLVLVPGLPTPLNIELCKAWTVPNNKKPSQVAKECITAFKNHSKMISGLGTWMGPVVAPTAPIPFPWVGIE